MTEKETKKQVEILFREAADMLRGLYPGTECVSVMALDSGKLSISLHGVEGEEYFSPEVDYYFFPKEDSNDTTD